MSDIMALDIETGNYSWEIGGWDKTASFEPTVVATWNGNDGTVYCNKSLDIDATVKELHPRTLGEDLAKHVAGGGVVIGHNIKGFDLPVLRDSLDMHYAGVLLQKDNESVCDTSWEVRSACGKSHRLDSLCKHTLGVGKEIMESADAPVAWREGRELDVMKYCIADCKLNYDLFQHGRKEGFVKGRNEETGIIDEYQIGW